MAKVKLTLIASPIDKTKRQKETLKSLGFKKMHQSVVRENNPQTEGMIRMVAHLIKVEQA